ncbi:13085_t:CDS:1, partial [Gigaspora rosea]
YELQKVCIGEELSNKHHFKHAVYCIMDLMVGKYDFIIGLIDLKGICK